MKKSRRLALGLDSSTQSLTAVLLDMDSAELVLEYSVSYRNDSRLNGFGFDHQEMIIPPREPGEADQPPKLFLASLDALFSDLQFQLQSQGLGLDSVVSINTSGQQHGHVYLGAGSSNAFAGLKKAESASSDLVGLLGTAFSYQTAPIWKTSNTGPDAEAIRNGVGGSAAMISVSGSDSPLRFTGAVVRRVGRQFPAVYAATERILLISNLIPAILAGDRDVPMDFGNSAGTSLMNYGKKDWDSSLLAAAAAPSKGDAAGFNAHAGLPGGAAGLRKKLPDVAHPLKVVGSVSAYFVQKYGFKAECAIVAGSGDNPQTKVLIDGDLLSLGTSFVMMAGTAEGTTDANGYANAMYDGLGRPFCFGCRTNGALTWDRIRSRYGLSLQDFASLDKALSSVEPGSVMRLWQPDVESFPTSKAGDIMRADNAAVDFEHDYAGVVDSALSLLWYYSRGFAGAGTGKTLYLTGGPTANKHIVRRVAAIWNCPVVVIGRAGAAMGTAVAAAAAIIPEAQRDAEVQRLCNAILGGAKPVLPEAAMVAAYHGNGGYLTRLIPEFRARLG